MKQRNRRTFARLIGSSAVGALAVAMAGIAIADRPAPEYPRSNARTALRHAVPTPSPAPAPPALRGPASVTRPGVASEPDPRRTPRNAATARGASTTEAATRGLERQAVAAGRWAAQAAVRDSGRTEYLRAGFHAGLRAALDDPRLGDVEFRSGAEAGWNDRSARRYGAELGEDSAIARASRRAALQVEEQYLDLSRDPVFRPRPGRPAFDGAPYEVDQPGLREVFVDYPLASVTSDARVLQSLHGAPWDPWRLHGFRSSAEFLDETWSDPATGLAMWKREGPGSRSIRELSPEQRRRFERSFRQEFDRQLQLLMVPHLHAAHDRGFREGWSYGAFVRGELSFRRGYAQGFADAVQDASVATFHATFVPVFEQQYAVAFADWESRPHLRIVDMNLRDSDDDGVYEPGEALTVGYELANYGGAAGRFDLALESPVLARSGRSTVTVGARSVVREDAGLRLRLDPRTASRTRSQITLRIDRETRALPLTVSHPLSIDRKRVEIRRWDLEGRLRIEVSVRNESRLSRDGELRLTSSDGRVFALPVELAGRAAAPTVFELEGLDPLALIAGELSLELTVTNGHVDHDRHALQLADSATDLRNRDLMELLARQARSSALDPDRVARTRRLLLNRLREDWRAAVRTSGNPYKQDRRRATGTTALGDLLLVTREDRREGADAPVFVGLSAEVESLVRDLPGFHPLLRKHALRLARELP